MKKSLIALAALAVVGAASAQSSVTLTGKLGVAYENGESAGAAPTQGHGIGVTDGNITFSATEDLGGGLKAGASMDIKSRGRGTSSVDGRDASLFLSGNFGTVTAGAIEVGNGLVDLGGAGAPVIGMDGAQGLATSTTTYSINRAVLSSAMNMDVLKYTSPTFAGGFSASVALMDANGAGGLESTATTQDATLVGFGYEAGPLAVAFDYTNFGKNSATATNYDNRTRLSASYDLGVVKLGAGYEFNKSLATTDNGEKQYLLGVSAPIGSALTVGANYAHNTKDGAVTVKGYELGANYALSKRTGVQVAYQNLSESDANGITAVAGSATNFRVRVMHSF